MTRRHKDVVIVGPPGSGRTTAAKRLSDRLGLGIAPGRGDWPSLVPQAVSGREPLIFDGCRWLEIPLNTWHRRALVPPYNDAGGAVLAARTRLAAEAVLMFCLPPWHRYKGNAGGVGHGIVNRYHGEYIRWPGIRCAYFWNDQSFLACVAITRFETNGSYL